MKKFAWLTVALVASGVGVYCKANPEALPYLDQAKNMSQRVWGSVEANPVPIYIAVGTFLLTFVYHWAKGKSFRESVEVAATRVTVVPQPQGQSVPAPENLVLKRAQARATRTQLLADQVALKSRMKNLPDAVVQAEKEFCFAEKAVNDAKSVLGEKHKVRNLAQNKLASLRQELATNQLEIDAIETELTKLAEVA